MKRRLMSLEDTNILPDPICLAHLDGNVSSDDKGNTISYSGARFGIGKFGNALTSGIAKVNVQNANMHNKDFTLSCWYSKINSGSNSTIGVRINCLPGDADFAQIGFNLYKGAQCSFALLIANSSLNNWTSLDSLKNVPSGDDGTFHFIAITYKAVSNLFKVYFDGILKQTVTCPLYYNGNQRRLNIRSMGASLDEVAIAEKILWDDNFEIPTQPFKIK